jgi:tyrosinase
MKISGFAVAALVSSVSAAPLQERTFLETDALAAEGVLRLGFYIAKNGYPNAKKCTLDNVAVRREW